MLLLMRRSQLNRFIFNILSRNIFPPPLPLPLVVLDSFTICLCEHFLLVLVSEVFQNRHSLSTAVTLSRFDGFPRSWAQRRIGSTGSLSLVSLSLLSFSI